MGLTLNLLIITVVLTAVVWIHKAEADETPNNVTKRSTEEQMANTGGTGTNLRKRTTVVLRDISNHAIPGKSKLSANGKSKEPRQSVTHPKIEDNPKVVTGRETANSIHSFPEISNREKKSSRQSGRGLTRGKKVTKKPKTGGKQERKKINKKVIDQESLKIVKRNASMTVDSATENPVGVSK